jgi:hypothetical protein
VFGCGASNGCLIGQSIVPVISIVRGVFMQKSYRTPPVVAVDRFEANVVRLQRKQAEARGEETSSSAEDVAVLSALMGRASIAARQMKYFDLASKQFSFEELVLSAQRAGFIQIGGNSQFKEVLFQWASGQPDLIFSILSRAPGKLSIVAESQADIFGLILTDYPHAATVSVELNPMLEKSELGQNALLFKDMLLTFPGFDDMPAWAKHPEGRIPDAGGLIEMWRDGVSVATLFSQTWNSILPRVLSVWELLRERWNTPR